MSKRYNEIYVSGPSITEKEIRYVNEAVKNAWYDNAGYYQKIFETNFKNYTGRKYAISLPSCTSAIHLALLSSGINEGDEVIVPDITWIATSAPISYVGATPVFADICERTWCINPESLEKRITDKTRAVIAVDLYGCVCDMANIRKITDAYSLVLIEDAAQAVGSEYNGNKAGSFGDISVFSFHGSKIMTTGEGGMLVTDNEDIYKRCIKLCDHGKSDSGKMFWNDEIGFKYKMSCLQAALGIAQLERIDELVEMKRNIFKWYKKGLESINGIIINPEPECVKSNFWMVTMVLDSKNYNITKEQMIEELAYYDIHTRPFFYPLSMLPAYKGIVKDKNYAELNPAAYKISPYAVNLPSGMNMTEDMAGRVCDCIDKILKGRCKNV